MEDQNKVEPNEVIQKEPVKVESVGSVEARPIEKKKVNGFAIFFGLTTLIFAGAAVFFGIEYFKPKESGSKDNCGVSGESSIVADVPNMAEDYKEVAKVVEDVTNTIPGGYYTGFENSAGLAYKPEELNSYVPMQLTIEKKIMNSNSTEKNMTLLKDAFESLNFSSIGILPFLGSAGPKIYGYLNTDSNIVCGMFEDYDSQLKKDGVFLECAKTDWVWLTDADKALASELETAYYEKTGEYPVVLFVDADESKIKDSQYKPYQTLMVSLGGGAGLFYRTSPEEKWQFFTGTQAAPGCDEYNTDDLKKAYLGETCYSDDGMVESTVRL